MDIQIPPDLVNKPDDYPQNLPAPEVRRRFLALLGEFETPSVPLDLRITEEILLPGNVVRQRATYAVAPGERAPAIHLFQKGLSADTPGILSIHAHGGEDTFRTGKETHCLPSPDDPSQYSYRLALAGFRVLAPDALCFGERRTKWGHSRFFMDEVLVHAELTSRGKSLLWKSVWDNSRAVEVLAQLGSSRIGSIGWSGGSTQNYVLASVNSKIEASVHFASHATLRHQFYQFRLNHCLYHYVPGMVNAGIDWDQVAALIPPRRCFLGRGAHDQGSPEAMYRAFVSAIREQCEREGSPDSLVVYEEPQGGHEITETMLCEAINFLRQSFE